MAPIAHVGRPRRGHPDRPRRAQPRRAGAPAGTREGSVVDLRRVPLPAQDIASDQILLAMIRDEIARSGPMTFARFMEIALYDPARGYYRGAVARPGRAGDFLTAPEASPIFGRTLARFRPRRPRGDRRAGQVHDPRARGGDRRARRATRRGAAHDRGRPTAIDYLVAEIEPARVDAVRRALADRPEVTVQPDDGRAIDGLVVGNEVLDALPTHRVVGRDGDLREILVAIGPDDALVDIESEPTTPGLGARLAAESIELAEGQRGEICLELDSWIDRAATGLARGVLLAIDYGHPAAELYDPARRAAGTLATYLGHQVGEDPYRAIGRQDLTAHVDMTAVERAATEAGLDNLGTTSQTDFLARLGIGDLLVAEQARPGPTSRPISRLARPSSG